MPIYKTLFLLPIKDWHHIGDLGIPVASDELPEGPQIIERQGAKVVLAVQGSEVILHPWLSEGELSRVRIITDEPMQDSLWSLLEAKDRGEANLRIGGRHGTLFEFSEFNRDGNRFQFRVEMCDDAPEVISTTYGPESK